MHLGCEGECTWDVRVKQQILKLTDKSFSEPN